MRELLPRPSAEVDLHEFYARDWLAAGGVRSDFVASVDGAASAQGRSEGLQTPGDNRVFQALRDLADAVVVGAATAAAEGYAPIDLDADRAAARRRYGFLPALPTVVVSNRLQVDPEAALFARDTVVVTCRAADTPTRERLGERCDVLVCGDSVVDLVAAVASLRDRGHNRILFEGGPRLQTSMLAEGVVDELCLSVTPVLSGPGAPRIVDGPARSGARTPLQLIGLLEEGGALFTRYRLG